MDTPIKNLFEHIVANDPRVGELLTYSEKRLRIAGMLRRIRSSLNLTQHDVAKKLGKPLSEVKRLENPQGMPQSTKALSEYARACGLTLGLSLLQINLQEIAVVETAALTHDESAEQQFRSLNKF